MEVAVCTAGSGSGSGASETDETDPLERTRREAGRTVAVRQAQHRARQARLFVRVALLAGFRYRQGTETPTNITITFILADLWRPIASQKERKL